MIYDPKTIEEYILFFLKIAPSPTKELLEKIQQERLGTTKQGFYQALRKLKKEEAVVVYGKRATLSHLWIKRMSEYFDEARSLYVSERIPGDYFLSLEEGEKVSYVFKSPAVSDVFWGHAFGLLAKKSTPEAVYIYNPHEWFILARTESEVELFEEITNSERQIFLLAGSNTPVDKYVSKYFDGKYGQYHALEKSLFEKENYYLNIFGDFIIEALIEKETAEKIDSLYKATSKFSEEFNEELKEIVFKNSKTKIIISRNKRKAQKLKTLFKKYFYIKK